MTWWKERAKTVFGSSGVCSQRNENIQYLRGIAILMIILFHFQMFYPMKQLEWVQTVFLFGEGNEVFFVITGYFLARKWMTGDWDVDRAVRSLLHKIRRLWIPLSIWGGDSRSFLTEICRFFSQGTHMVVLFDEFFYRQFIQYGARECV